MNNKAAQIDRVRHEMMKHIGKEGIYALHITIGIVWRKSSLRIGLLRYSYQYKKGDNKIRDTYRDIIIVPAKIYKRLGENLDGDADKTS